MKLGERETRTFPLMEMQSRQGLIVGKAIVFNSPANIGGMFDEVIRREAVEKALARDGDIRAFWNHESTWVIGRTKSGTLRLALGADALEMEIQPPDSVIGQHFLAVVKRGDVDGASFAFVVREQNIVRGGGADGRDLREVLDMELIEVSPVAMPAYAATVVSARGNADPSAASGGLSLVTRERELALRKRNG